MKIIAEKSFILDAAEIFFGKNTQFFLYFILILLITIRKRFEEKKEFRFLLQKGSGLQVDVSRDCLYK